MSKADGPASYLRSVNLEVPSPDDGDTNVGERPEEGPFSHAPREIPKVMVVGPEHEELVSLTRSLEDSGFQLVARAAQTPDGLRRLLGNQNPDALVIRAAHDGPLPPETALDVALERKPDFPVLCVSTWQRQDEAVRAIHLGFADYLHEDHLERLPSALVRAMTAADERRRRAQLQAELERKEKAYQTVLEAAPVGVLILDVDPALTWLDFLAGDLGDENLAAHLAHNAAARRDLLALVQIERANAGACRITGATESDELVGGLDPRLGEDFESMLTDLLLAAHEGQEHFEAETRLIRLEDETEIVVLATSRLQPDPENTRVAMGLVDVTVRRALEDQLREALRLEAVGKLAGGLAHDFNNLLTVIHTSLSLLEDTTAHDPEAAEDVAAARQAAERAAGLTRQLLALSRPSSGEGTSQWCALLKDMQPMLGRLLGDEIELSLDLEDEAAIIPLERGRAEQVLVSLLANGRDAMRGQGRIEVRHRVVDKTTVILEVEDHGSGMKPEVAARVFEPFFTTKGPDRGTGLGLAMVASILREAEGEIEVDSRWGQGTVFRVRLPRRRTFATQEGPPLRVESIQGLGVLLVDDDPDVRRSTQRLLERLGYTVWSASDPDQADELLDAHHEEIDVVLSDVVMPGGGGEAVRLLAAERGRPVVFMSGHSESAIPLRQPRSPAAVLAKPFTADELRQALARAVRG